MLADLIREFCKEPENNYEVYENYTSRMTTFPGEETTITTIGIVVKQGDSFFDMMDQLGLFLEAKGVLDADLIGEELEGTGWESLGPDTVVYFPNIQDYHPLQP